MSVTAKSVVEQILGELDERPQGFAYCKCPGADRHSARSGPRDCRVYYQTGAPTIYCLHSSCAGVIEETNRALRSALGKLAAGGNIAVTKFVKSSEQIAREREQKRKDALATAARVQLPAILAEYPWPPDQIFSDSPEGVADDPARDWQMILRLFAPEETLWIGDQAESGGAKYAAHFKTAQEWVSEDICPKGPFILPAALTPKVNTRRKIDIARLPFLVVESDTLDKAELGALFRWLCEVIGLTLVAVVDTGGEISPWLVCPARCRDIARLESRSPGHAV